MTDRIRYDNLKEAVTKVLKGRTRIEAERFVVLRSHYALIGRLGFWAPPWGGPALVMRACNTRRR